MRWRHPEDRVAIEVRWSAKKRGGKTHVYYYFSCSVCEPKAQVFLNDWTESDGLTVVQAEAEGYRPKVAAERKAELLAELGLRSVPQIQNYPMPGRLPAPAPIAALPPPRTRKRRSPRTKRSSAR
jgi:hypothetical protein